MDIFGKFKQFIQIKDVQRDNRVFELHYRVTALILLCCGGLVASKQYFGDPIDCITPKADVPSKLMDTYCWIHSTFTLPEACNKTVGVEVAHPCVDKFSHNGEQRVYHKYYQWVYFVLFFQAALFYAPHFFWKSYDAKLLNSLTSELRHPLIEEEKKEKAFLVVEYLVRHHNMHEEYYNIFTLFEVCNFLNVIGQVYLVDEFLGGTFTTFGLDVLNYGQLEQEDRVDPMVKVFPRMTKCTFHWYGSSGDVQTHDALCILPLNIINEKIYVTMWFWFVFLAFVTGVWLIYRALTYIGPGLRFRYLKKRATFTDDKCLSNILERSKPGNWFLLCMVCKNMDAYWFHFVMKEYSDRLLKNEEAKRNRNESIGGGRRRRRPGRLQDNGTRPMLADNDDDDYLSELENGGLGTDTSNRSKASALLPKETFDGVAVDPPPQLKRP